MTRVEREKVWPWIAENRLGMQNGRIAYIGVRECEGRMGKKRKEGIQV